MKKLLSTMILLALCVTISLSQEKQKSTLWAVHHITPKRMASDVLIKRISDHDAKYHEGKSVILSVITGDNSGDIMWAYGPMTYEEMDAMNPPEGHEKDNLELMQNYVDEYHSMTLWKAQPDVSVDFGDEMPNHTMRNHSTIKLMPGKWEEWKSLVQKHIDVYNKHKFAEVFVYTAVYGTKDGYDVLLISPFKNFASFDDDWGYKEKFEAMHGEGSLKKTSDKLTEITEAEYSFMTVINEKK